MTQTTLSRSTKRPRRKSSGKGRRKRTSRDEIGATITKQILAQLEDGTVPWVKPWETCGPHPMSLPRNGSTDTRYSGINILLLWNAVQDKDHSTPIWMTYKQADGLGAQVRRGERGTTIVRIGKWTPEEDRDKGRLLSTGETSDEAPERVFLRRYTVFNADQIDGLPEDIYTPPPPPDPAVQHELAEAIIRATGADVQVKGDLAYYNLGSDRILVPAQAQFETPLEYYRTVFHELTHWTGHPSRLAREIRPKDEVENYAFEELVAEMGAAFICSEIGIPPTLRHADYIAHWMKQLEADDGAILRAASAASLAHRFIMEIVEGANILGESPTGEGAP